jgi:hypothetical protein
MLCGLALVGTAILLNLSARADDKDNPLAAVEKAIEPGPEHKVLEPLVGDWTFTTRFWMDPSKPPMESKGTASRKWIMGGKFVQEEVNSEFFGKPFKGTGITGYDKIQGKYVGVWVDSLSTGISQSQGTADKAGKVLTFSREDYDPFSKEKIKGRDVVRILDKDKHVMEMYKIGPDGKETKVMEIVFTRQAEKPGK